MNKFMQEYPTIEAFWEAAHKEEMTIHSLMTTDIYLGWDWPMVGFGQLSIHLRKQDDGTHRLEAMNECMGRDAVRKMLHAWADFVADRVYLDNGKEPPKQMPPPEDDSWMEEFGIDDLAEEVNDEPTLQTIHPTES